MKIFKYKKDKRREVNKLKTLKKFKTFMMEPLAKISMALGRYLFLPKKAST